jgi:hypothetical protein
MINSFGWILGSASTRFRLAAGWTLFIAAAMNVCSFAALTQD